MLLCLRKPFSWRHVQFFPSIFHLAPHGHSHLLTSKRLRSLCLFAYFRNPQKGFLHPQILDKKLKKGSPFVRHQQWLAVSSASGESILIITVIVSLVGNDVVRPLLRAIWCSLFYHDHHLFRDINHSLYLQNRNWLDRIY